MRRPRTVAELVKLTDVPVVCIDDHGSLTFINKAFEQTYGWTKADLLNQPVMTIMPPQFRDAHVVGFSRFLATEAPTLIGKPLPLAILHKNGTIDEAEHFILGEKKQGKWRFAATIKSR